MKRDNLEKTDYALKLYNKTHRHQMARTPLGFNKHQFSDFYKPSATQKQERLFTSELKL